LKGADVFYLKFLREQVPSKEAYRKIILEAFGKRAAIAAVDWKENVADYIVACRTDGGIPMFRTRYGEQPLKTPDDKRVVLAVCWAGKGTMEGQFFVNVPEGDIETLERTVGNWKFLIEKYGSPEDVKAAYEAPVIL